MADRNAGGSTSTTSTPMKSNGSYGTPTRKRESNTQLSPTISKKPSPSPKKVRRFLPSPAQQKEIPLIDEVNAKCEQFDTFLRQCDYYGDETKDETGDETKDETGDETKDETGDETNDEPRATVLKLPTVSKINEDRFPLNGEYVYIHRTGIMNKLTDVVNTWIEEDKIPMQKNLLGFKRCGKSYVLATFVCLLRKQLYKVLYIHNCADMAANPLRYLKREALATFFGDQETQNKIMELDKTEDIINLLETHKVIVVADQVGALYEKDTGQVIAGNSEMVLRMIKSLSGATLVLTAASARKTIAFVAHFTDIDKRCTIPFFEGFTREEFDVYRQHCLAYKVMREEDIEKVERLTGFLPGLLSLPYPDQEHFKLSQRQLDESASCATPNSEIYDTIRLEMMKHINSCFRHVKDEHRVSHQAAVLGHQYLADDASIDFDIVSIPGTDMMVHCPSLFCKDVLSDYLASKDHDHELGRLHKLYEELKTVRTDSRKEPTKVGDAVEDCLIAFMQTHEKCPIKLPHTLDDALGRHFPKNFITLHKSRKFETEVPEKKDLRSDFQEIQKKASEPIAIAYFPKGKFLRYIDFVIRLFIPSTESGEEKTTEKQAATKKTPTKKTAPEKKTDKNPLMYVIAGQITLSKPKDHSHTWKFFKEDYKKWETGYESDEVDTHFLLTWFTPHSMPDLGKFDFTTLPAPIKGNTFNISFADFGSTDGSLGRVLSPLANPDVYEGCGCEKGCHSGCRCRKARIPCRNICKCEKQLNRCMNPVTGWTHKDKKEEEEEE